MKWKPTLISIFILTSFSLLLTSNLLAANPSELESQINKVRQDREALIAEQKRLEQELDLINKESQTLGAAVKSLDTTRKKLATDIGITQSKISSTNLNILSLENTMSEKEKQIIIHRQAISGALLAISDFDARPFILNLLAATELSEILKDRGDLEDLNAHLEEEIDALRETRIVLGQEKVQKEKIRQEQLSLKNQLQGQKSVVDENQKAKSTLLAETKNKETEYQRLLQANLAAQKQFEDDLLKLEENLRITLDPSLLPTRRPGVLSWPLDKIFITDKFGQVTGRYHNGVDFRASQGTRVLAVLGGVITGTGNTDERNAEYRRAGKPACVSYGRWILIRHDNGLSSVYAHLSGSLVQTGQVVKVGEVIGYSGGAYGVNGSGYSFGPHLHMGLLATQGVEIRQLTNSKGGCKETFMPVAKGTDAYLDPLVYLPTL